MKQHRFWLVAASLLLIFEFGARLFFPAQETESTGLSLLRIVFDCGMIVAVIGISVQNLKAASRPIDAVGAWMFFPAFGLLAGLGLFVLRLSGGLPAELPPRPIRAETTLSELVNSTAQTGSAASTGTPTARPTLEFDPDKWLLAQHIKTLAERFDESSNDLAQARWTKALTTDAPAQVRDLTQEDLRDYRRKVHALNVALDEDVKDFAEAKAKGIEFKAFLDDPRYDPKVTAAYKALLNNVETYYRLIDENWTEYRERGIEPKDGSIKPWQEEAARLDREKPALMGKLREAWPFLRASSP